jgi:hypothetical protein
VVLRCLEAEEVLTGDLRVAAPASDELQDLAFPVAELGNACGATGLGSEKRAITRRAMPGPKMTSPLATALMARSISASSAPLST